MNKSLKLKGDLNDKIPIFRDRINTGYNSSSTAKSNIPSELQIHNISIIWDSYKTSLHMNPYGGRGHFWLHQIS